MNRTILLLFLISSWFSILANNGQITIHNLPDSAISLRPNLQIFTDESNQMTWEEIYERQQSGEFSAFDSYKFKSVLERGKYTYWFYLPMDYLSKDKEKGIVRGIGGATLTLWQFKDGRLLDKVLGGGLTPATDTAEIAYYKSDLPIEIPFGKSELLIKYTNTPTHYLAEKNIRLIKASTGLHKKNKAWLLYYASMGLFMGILLYVLLSTIAQYFQVRDKAFLFYAIYVISLLLYYWRFFAGDNPFFRIMPPEMGAREYFTLFNLPIYFTYTLFIDAFIGDKKAFPSLMKAIKIFMSVIIAYFIIERTAMYLNPNWAYRIEKIGRPIFLIFGLYLIFSLLKSKMEGPIRFILYGTFAMIGATLFGLLLTFYGNTTWYSFDIVNSINQIGVIVELLCFSMGLGAKTKLIEKEKNEAKLAFRLKAKESESLKEVNLLKNQFFTNITHEFRTPLTVIQGITQQLQENPHKDLNRRTNLIQSNANNLLNLVNQLLDLSKADLKKYTIQNTQQDILKYLSYLTESFHSLAFAKKITLSFYAYLDQQLMDYDPNIIKTIGTNLIGNALKFTPEYGQIKVSAKSLPKTESQAILQFAPNENILVLDYSTNKNGERSNDFSNYLQLQFRNTGHGIAPEHLPHIFDRFYQADSTDAKTAYGTGIGLALVKELMDLLGGIIKVDSRGKAGVTFTLLLPIRNNTPLENSLITPLELIKDGEATSDYLVAEQPAQAVQSKAVNKPLLLIVEDNRDVIYYLISCLSKDYRVLEATNGQMGLALALEHIPDVVLSDVMMPQMNGYELCHRLKNDARTSHIPIILLTAKTATESKYKGLESGADAYLAKPFDKKELLLRLENLILLKKQMQLHLQLSQHTSISSNEVYTSITQKEMLFLQDLQKIIDQHLNDELFKAPQLAKAMMMSQTQLYRKLKALTNQSTAQYIKTIRLEKAKKLLESTDYSIGQVATEVGFKTQSHFARSFQEEFGQRPSDIRK